jgi:hypothetical protein
MPLPARSWHWLGRGNPASPTSPAHENEAMHIAARPHPHNRLIITVILFNPESVLS